MFKTTDFPDQPASRRGRRLRMAGGLATAGALVTGGLVVATNAGAGNNVWERVAMCESSGDWHINTDNGFYGGLQFTFQTWKGFGGQKYAYTANHATKSQQIEIAQEVLKVQGPGAWPVCSKEAGLTVANGLAVDPRTGEERPSRDDGRDPVGPTEPGDLVVDGIRGPKTTTAIEKWVDGSVDYGNTYLSWNDIRKLQIEVGSPQDGVIGPITTSRLQRTVGADVDGVWGSQTTTHLQRYLNQHVL